MECPKTKKVLGGVAQPLSALVTPTPTKSRNDLIALNLHSDTITIAYILIIAISLYIIVCRHMCNIAICEK
jgi:hypothetical protein